MDYILELKEDNQLPLPDTLIKEAGLEPGAHFEARFENNRITIKQLPFSSIEEGEILEKTINELKRK